MKQKRHSGRIHSLYDSLVHRDFHLEDILIRIINEGIKAFDLEIGIISRIENSKYTIIGS
ncbi:sensor domain-containing diguanylate cyclase, partial [Klebsiella pneumoniae]